ncbi:hypothetical protein AGMMS50229_01050 [Campylobacterota bacterium]|nr:hypothetical protein AGMMS50229_01050 [Campylobacterota bacterium]
MGKRLAAALISSESPYFRKYFLFSCLFAAGDYLIVYTALLFAVPPFISFAAGAIASGIAGYLALEYVVFKRENSTANLRRFIFYWGGIGTTYIVRVAVFELWLLFFERSYINDLFGGFAAFGVAFFCGYLYHRRVTFAAKIGK